MCSECSVDVTGTQVLHENTVKDCSIVSQRKWGTGYHILILRSWTCWYYCFHNIFLITIVKYALMSLWLQNLQVFNLILHSDSSAWKTQPVFTKKIKRIALYREVIAEMIIIRNTCTQHVGKLQSFLTLHDVAHTVGYHCLFKGFMPFANFAVKFLFVSGVSSFLKIILHF
jgi:hypothetical protein